MGNLLDSTGKEARSRKLSDEDILKLITELRYKTDALGHQAMMAALLIEFIIDRVNLSAEAAQLDDATMKQVFNAIKIDPEDYKQFHDERMREMQEQMQEQMKEMAGLSNPLNLSE